jgi:hypothetical protein
MAERQGRNVMVSTFRVPDEYERARLEAERRAALAQMLEAQAYEPLNVNQAAPIAPSQGLAKILKSYVGAYQRRKAEEAEEKAKGKEEETAEQIMGRLMGRELPEFEPDEAKRAEQEAARAKEIADVRADIEPSIARQRETGQLEEVMPTAQYTRDPMEALRLAGTPAGQGALQRNQVLAGLLARSVEQPAQEEFYAPVVGEGGKYVQFGKRGGTRASDVAAPAPAPAAVTTATIMKDGKPTVIDARTGKRNWRSGACNAARRAIGFCHGATRADLCSRKRSSGHEAVYRADLKARTSRGGRGRAQTQHLNLDADHA